MLIRDLKPGDAIPGCGVVNSMEWTDHNRVRITLVHNRRIVADTWDGDFPVPTCDEEG